MMTSIAQKISNEDKVVTHTNHTCCDVENVNSLQKCYDSMIRARFSDLINDRSYVDTLNDIKYNLKQSGIDFEGKNLNVSLLPSVLSWQNLNNVVADGKLIQNALLKIIQMFLIEDENGRLHQFFLHYKKWWKLIKEEKRKTHFIGLMRFDAILGNDGLWSFLENNTACPGGVIHCGKIRDAWLKTRLGHKVTRNLKLKKYAIDDSSGFLLYLANKAQKISTESHPNIAICHYKGTYKNELESLKRKYDELELRGVIHSGQLVICDIRDLSYQSSDDSLYYGNKKISLVYNKLDPLMIDPHDREIDSWVKGSKSTQCEFLNSIAAMYLTEAKSSLALLTDSCWAQYLGLTLSEQKAIDRCIPKTKKVDLKNFPEFVQNRHKYIIKADALTRGKGIVIGKYLNYSRWCKALLEIMDSGGVVQELVDIPKRPNFINLNEEHIELFPVNEFYGFDLFYFEDDFSGVVGRSHTHEIFNIGNGGQESPVLVIK